MTKKHHTKHRRSKSSYGRKPDRQRMTDVRLADGRLASASR